MANPAVVNVASVRHLSPFRYPGGKTWLVPYVTQWIGQQRTRAGLFIEPFAGGSIVGLTVAMDQLADHVVLIERDDDVAAVWRRRFVIWPPAPAGSLTASRVAQ